MTPNFRKYSDGLLPAIIQDNDTGKVLMLGFMNEEAYSKTINERRVHFYSRSKKRLWLKGETSGNFLELKGISLDCDNDTALIKVIPTGPVCHTGADTCFNEPNQSSGFLEELESIINKRKETP
jgi:phosphoribosyl-AMP cyclohydrolase / phosphoribosyl-ATP pyrophosphohydrolase